MQETADKFKLNIVITLVLVTTLIGLAVYGVNKYSVENKADTMMAEKISENNGESLPASEDAMMESEAMVESTDSMEPTEAMTDDSMMAESSGYVEYSESAYAEAEGKQRVLFFHASWCPTCKIANAELLDRLADIPEDVVVFKVDYDTETELKDTYGVTYQHTFVLVDDDDQAVTKWNGGGVDAILNKVQ